MNKERKINTLFVAIIVIPLLIGYFYYDTRRTSGYLERLYQEYPKISYDDSIGGVITHIGQPDYSYNIRYSPDIVFVTLNDSVNYRFLSMANGSTALADAVRTSSYIKKRSQSDTLIVYTMEKQDTLKLLFRLLDDEGYMLKK